MSFSARYEAPKPLLPGSFARHARTRGAEAASLFLAVAALSLFLALVTWNAADPSFSHETSSRPTNIFGGPGAATADILMQLIGLASIGLVVILSAWATDLWATKRFIQAKLRLVLAPPAIFFLAGALSSLPQFGYWPLSTTLGGTMGESQAFVLADLLRNFGFPRAPALATLILLALSLMLFSLSTGLTFDSLSRALRRAATEVPRAPHDHRQPVAREPMRQAANAEPPPLSSAPTPEPPRPTMHVPATQRPDVISANARPDGRREPTLPTPRRISPQLAEPEIVSRDVTHPIDAVDEFQRPTVISQLQATDGRPVPTAANTSMRTILQALRTEENARQAGLQPTSSDASESQPGRRTSQLASISVLLNCRPALPQSAPSPHAMMAIAEALIGAFDDFGVAARLVDAIDGPVVMLLVLELPATTSIERVQALTTDVAQAIDVASLRAATDPETGYLIVEIAHATARTVTLAELARLAVFRETPARIPLALGKTPAGEPQLCDLVALDHLLVAGGPATSATATLLSLGLTPLFRVASDRLHYIIADATTAATSVLTAFENLPQQAIPQAIGTEAAFAALHTLERTVDQRHEAMARIGVHSIDVYNNRIRHKQRREKIIGRSTQVNDHLEPFSRILALIHNLDVLMTAAPVETARVLGTILDLGPDAGVHVIAGISDANPATLPTHLRDRFKGRLVFQQATRSDSLWLLGMPGADLLESTTDALFMADNAQPLRLHMAETCADDVRTVIASLLAAPTSSEPRYRVHGDWPDVDAPTDQGVAHDELSASEPGKPGSVPFQFDQNHPANSNPEPMQPELDEALYERAINVVLRNRQPYSGQLARALSIARADAVVFIERMVEDGIVSPADDVGNQRVLIERRARVLNSEKPALGLDPRV